MKFNPEKIREFRLKNRHSLGTVVRLLRTRFNYKVSRSSVCNWERGRTMPGIKALIALCLLFEVEPNYFFSEKQANSLLAGENGSNAKEEG